VQEIQAYARSTQKRFEGGLGTRFDVLEAERQVTFAERSQSLARHELQVSLVRLYKSMGGGWQVAAPELLSAAASADKN
jgi:outer membrane protein TolC